MPTTTYNITRIKKAVDNVGRQEILDVLDEICLIALQDNTMRVERIDPATGKPPFLATEAGKLKYDCPADCRETAAVFVENTRTYSPFPSDFYKDYVWREIQYQKVVVKQISATIDTLATVQFPDDPGDTTEIYYHQYFFKYTKMTSEAVQLPFPEELHYVVRNGVIQMLRGETYSSGMGDIDPIQKVVSLIRSKLNKGANYRLNRTPVQVEQRDDDFAGYF